MRTHPLGVLSVYKVAKDGASQDKKETTMQKSKKHFEKKAGREP